MEVINHFRFDYGHCGTCTRVLRGSLPIDSTALFSRVFPVTTLKFRDNGSESWSNYSVRSSTWRAARRGEQGGKHLYSGGGCKVSGDNENIHKKSDALSVKICCCLRSLTLLIVGQKLQGLPLFIFFHMQSFFSPLLFEA